MQKPSKNSTLANTEYEVAKVHPTPPAFVGHSPTSPGLDLGISFRTVAVMSYEADMSSDVM